MRRSCPGSFRAVHAHSDAASENVGIGQYLRRWKEARVLLLSWTEPSALPRVVLEFVSFLDVVSCGHWLSVVVDRIGRKGPADKGKACAFQRPKLNLPLSSE